MGGAPHRGCNRGEERSRFRPGGVDRPTTITRLRWRGEGGVTYAGGGKYGNVIITISTMPNPTSSLTTATAFAGNHGADVVEVYNGAVDVGVLSGTTPNDWHIDVTLQKPFTYDPSNGPLMVELAAQDSTFTGPSMGAAGVRLDLSSNGGTEGYNRIYDVNAHDAAAPTGTNLCGAVMEITSGQGFTVAYDPVGGPYIATLIAAAQPGAKIVNYGNLHAEPVNFPMLPMLAKRLNLKCHSCYDTVRDPDALARGYAYVFDRVGSGALKPVIARTFPLDQIVEAHRYMEAQTHIGKIVVTT